MLKNLTLIVLLVCSAQVAFADKCKWRDPTTGITWTYDIWESGSVCLFPDGYKYPAVSPQTMKHLDIPSHLGGLPVTDLYPHAFQDCINLTSVTIPATVTNICGRRVFRGCDKLVSVDVAADNPVYKCIDGFVCTKDGATLVIGKGGDVTVPRQVKQIGWCAFSYEQRLRSVSIPFGVESIADEAFACCRGLTSATVSSSVKTIGPHAFSSCEQLSKVTLSEGLRTIDRGAFRNCEELTELTIPSTVESIGEGAFAGCSKLNSVEFGKGLRHIGEWSFEDCKALTSLTFPYGITTIDKRAFAGCERLSVVTLPRSVNKVGDGAFRDDYMLGRVFIAKGDTFRMSQILAGSNAPIGRLVECDLDEGSSGWGVLAAIIALLLAAVGVGGLMFYRRYIRNRRRAAVKTQQAIVITCPHCGESCETEMELQVGQRIQCPFCDGKFEYGG